MYTVKYSMPPTEARYPPIGGRCHPPLTEATPSAEGVASVHGVQRPISLEYQTYPPTIDTLVTGMVSTTLPFSG